MDDLISKEAVIQALDGLEMFFPGGYDDRCYLSRADVLNAINSAPEEPQWIPCKERLPEYGETVLTQFKDEYMELNWIIDEDLGKWFWENPVAWMPLPEPYEEEE